MFADEQTARAPADPGRGSKRSSAARPDRLKAAIRELYAEFGKVTSMSIMTMTEAEQRRALCFLRLESQAQEIELMSSLGAGRFGNEVLIVVDLAR